MSDVVDRVKKIVVEHLGVDEAKVTGLACNLALISATGFLALSELCSTASGLRKKTGRFPCRHSARDATARSRMAAAM